MKKFISVLLCLVMVFSFSTVAFAKSVSFKTFFPNFYEKISEYDQGDQNYVIPVHIRESTSETQKTNIKRFLSEYIDSSSTYIVRLTDSGAFYVYKFSSFPTLKTQYDSTTKNTNYVYSSSKVESIMVSFSSADNHYFVSSYSTSSSVNLYQTLYPKQWGCYIANNPSNGSLYSAIPVFNDIQSIDFQLVGNTKNLTVNYKYPDGTQAAESVSQTLEVGAEYSIPSPTVEGYRPDKETVSGIMPDEDLTMDVTYSKGLYYLTVKYQYEDGSQAFPDFQSSYLYGFSYSVDSPALAGYSPDKSIINGVMPGNDVSFTVTYKKDSGGPSGPDGPGDSGSDEKGPFYGYNAFDKPFQTDNITAQGYNPFLPLYNMIQGFSNPFASSAIAGATGKDPFQLPDLPTWDSYDPFHDSFSSSNIGSGGNNPYSSLYEQIQGFSSPLS